MTHKNRHFTMERFFVYILVFQGVLWSLPHFGIAFLPLDDEDYLTGKRRIVRSNSGSCRFGWHEFGDKCFIGFGENAIEQKTWPEASKHCRYMHSTLASIHSIEEQNYLEKFNQFSDVNIIKGVWLGLHRRNYGDYFRWVDGSPLDFTNWKTAMPHIHHKGKSCVQMHITNGGRWTDGSCRFTRPYICQSLKVPNDTFLDGSSGDGEEASCNDNMCQNGGSCVNGTTVEDLQCVCATGYKGSRCEERALCTVDACENGGSCVEEVEDFKCICMDGYNGETCEEKISFPGMDISEHIYIIGAVTAVISLIIIVVAFVLFKRSRNRGKNSNDNVAKPDEDKAITMSSCKRAQSED